MPTLEDLRYCLDVLTVVGKASYKIDDLVGVQMVECQIDMIRWFMGDPSKIQVLLDRMKSFDANKAAVDTANRQ